MGTFPTPLIALGAVTDAKVAAANKDGAPGTPSMRTLGTGANQAAAGNDARLSDARTPTGPASGDLTGTYPAPSLAPPEAWHEVGFGGCAFQGIFIFWTNYDAANDSTVAYMRDREGFVHLKGTVTCPVASQNPRYIFYLPVGYRPAAIEHFATTANNAYATIEVDSGGTQPNRGYVAQTTGDTTLNTPLSIDGIEFRCSPSGAGGCP